jgi:hypothetical protein
MDYAVMFGHYPSQSGYFLDQISPKRLLHFQDKLISLFIGAKQLCLPVDLSLQLLH